MKKRVRERRRRVDIDIDKMKKLDFQVGFLEGLLMCKGGEDIDMVYREGYIYN